MLIFCRCSEINKYKLYPWIHQFSNNRRSADQIRPIFFPDVDPHSLPPGSNFSMTAGDFQEIYSECSKSKDHMLYSKFNELILYQAKVVVIHFDDKYKVYFNDNLEYFQSYV